MSHLDLGGLGVDVPDGWEAELGWAGGSIPPSGGVPDPDGPGPRVVAHLANFMLPPGRGDYGSGAVELMDSGAIFISIMEFERSARAPSLFSGTGVPSRIHGADFSPDQLQRRLPGQAGLQRFFTVGDRRFVLYVVIGSYRMRDVLAPEVARLLGAISFT